MAPAVTYTYDLWNPQNKAAVTKYPAIISIAYKWAGEKDVHVLSVNKMYNDKKVLKDFAKVYAEAEATIAYNGNSFDTKYLNTRALLNGLDPFPPIKQIDPFRLIKKHFKFLSNSLEYVAKSLGIEEKGKIPWSVWQSAIEGDINSLKQILDYNIQDVIVLEQLFNKILPFCHGLNLTPKEKDAVFCRACGSHDLERRGFTYLASGNKKQRYRCTKCSAWSAQ